MVNERREFSRIPIPADQAATVLYAGRRPSVVQLVDASPYGFAITCPVTLKAKCGALLRIRTTEGWHEVRVVRVEANGDSQRLGLERVRYLGEQLQPSWTDHWPLMLVLIGALSIGIAGGAFFVPDWWRYVSHAIAHSAR